MKSRNGFVSNSSSTSFVIAFPHKPKTVEELKVMLFGDASWSHSFEYYGSVASVAGISGTVFNDIKKGGQGEKLNNRSAEESVLGGYVESIRGTPESKRLEEDEEAAFDAETKMYHEMIQKYKKFDDPDGDDAFWYEKHMSAEEKVEWKKLRIALEIARVAYYDHLEKMAKNLINEFKEKNKGSYVCVLEYGDRYGESVLENCGIFDNVPHITVSNH